MITLLKPRSRSHYVKCVPLINDGRNPRYVLTYQEGRILKHLASMGMILEVKPDMYAPTASSDALTIPSIQMVSPNGRNCEPGLHRDINRLTGSSFDINTPAIHNLHKYLTQHEYKNPVRGIYGTALSRWATQQQSIIRIAQRESGEWRTFQ